MYLRSLVANDFTIAGFDPWVKTEQGSVTDNSLGFPQSCYDYML